MENQTAKALLIEQNKEYSRIVVNEKRGDTVNFSIIPIAEFKQYLTKRIPVHQTFNLLAFKNDSILNIQTGCDRYTECKLLSTKNGFVISGKYDRFYNMAEEAFIRADKITNYLNDQEQE